MALPAILGLAGNVVRTSAAGSLSGAVKSVAMDSLKSAVKKTPGMLMRASGASNVPILSNMYGMGADVYSRTQANREKQREAQRQREREQQESMYGNSSAGGSSSSDPAARAEMLEDDNRERQQEAHEAATRHLDSGGSSLTIIARDVGEIKEGISFLAENGKKEEKSGGLLQMLGGLLMAGLSFISALPAKLGPMIAGALSKLLPRGMGNLVRGAFGVASRVLAPTAATFGLGKLFGGGGGATPPPLPTAATRPITTAAGAANVGGGVVGRTAARSLGKAVLKKIPVIGAVAGLGFAAQRAMAGDWSGAGMEAASGLAGTLPGLGTAASVGIDAALAARDISRSSGGSTVTAPPARSSVAATAAQTSAGGRNPLLGGVNAMVALLDEMFQLMSTSSKGIYTKSADLSAILSAGPDGPSSWWSPSRWDGTGGNGGGFGGSGGSQITPITPERLASYGDEFDRQLLDGIAAGEAGKDGYDSVVYASRLKPPKPLSQMTFGEVKAWQKATIEEQKSRGIPYEQRSSAAGRYQFISQTLANTQEAAGFSDDDLFSPENQDKLALALADSNKHGLTAFKTGKATAAQFQDFLASQWASQKASNGVGLYNHVGSNHAGHSFMSNLQAYESKQTQGLRESAQAQQKPPVAAPVVIQQPAPFVLPAQRYKQGGGTPPSAPPPVRDVSGPVMALNMGIMAGGRPLH